MLSLIALAYAGLFFWEGVPLLREGARRDKWCFAALGILSLTTAVLLGLDIRIPSPEEPIRKLVQMITSGG